MEVRKFRANSDWINTFSVDPDGMRAPLRQAGLLSRDPRMKERKKYGLKRARKAPQYTKR